MHTLTGLRLMVAAVGGLVVFLLSSPVAHCQAKHLPGAGVKLDNFGDPLPPGAVARLGTLRFRPPGGVTTLAVSPDGKTLATAGRGWGVCLWELATGKQILRFADGDYPILVAFADQGRTLISVELGGAVRFRDLATGKEIHRLHLRKDPKQTEPFGALTPDGRFLAIRDTVQGVIALWDLTARKEVRRFSVDRFDDGVVAVSPDGTTVAASAVLEDDGPVALWDVATGKQRLTIRCKTSPDRLDFSPDGKTLVSGSARHAIRSWEVATGKELRYFGQAPCSPSATSLHAFSPDGKLLATLHDGADFTVRVWEAATGKQLRRWPIPTQAVNALVFTPDGKTVIGAGDDRVIRLWDVVGGKSIAPVPFPNSGPHALVASADGSLLAAAHGHDLHLWSVPARNALRQFEGMSWHGHVAFTPDGKHLAYDGDDASVRLCDVVTGKEVVRSQEHNQGVAALAFTPDGRTLFTVDVDQTLRTWEVATGKELGQMALDRSAVRGDFEGAPSVRNIFSRDARVLLTTFRSKEETYRLWHTAEGRRYDAAHKRSADLREPQILAPDGRTFASVSQKNVVDLFEVSTGKKRITLQPSRATGSQEPRDRTFQPLTFSPDGRLLAARAPDWESIDLWDVATGELVHHIDARQGALTTIAFIGAGDLLATGGSDTTVLLWDVAEVRRRARPPARALTAAESDKLWEQLGSDQPHEAIWKLAAGGDGSVPLLRKRLPPAAAPPPLQTTRWLGQLTDKSFAVREDRVRKLAQLGERAEPALRAYLDSAPSLEGRRRAEGLLHQIQRGREAGPTPVQVHHQRALEVLEHIGTPQATEFVRELAGGAAGAWLTREARATLDRMRLDASR
jgi:WD40 repeat protein